VALRIGATGAVTVALGVVADRSASLLLQWRTRSEQVVDRRKRRRDAAEAAAAAVPAGVWADFYERCLKAARRAESAVSASAASTRRTPQQPRGRSHRQQVGRPHTQAAGTGARGALFEGQNRMLGVSHGPKFLFAMTRCWMR